MAEAGENDVLQRVELLFYPGVDPRVAVTKNVHPPGADGIDVALAIEVLQPDPLTTANGHKREPLVVLHLGAGVPQGREVTLDKLVVMHRRFEFK